MILSNSHHSFSIKFIAYNEVYEEQEYEEFVIDESTINTLNIEDILDELREKIADANDHIIDRMENE
tara:strand:- start:1361 stop:1561 length:201 start_codon:yes stop_codon:yes gene_type:complete